MIRKIEQYANCDPCAIIDGSRAQVLYFMKDAKSDIVEQHACITILENENKRLREALKEAAKLMKNARSAVESNQVADKDVHGTLTRGINDARAALEAKS